MDEQEKLKKTEERRSFVFLAVIIAPILSVAIVGTYGFIVWMYHAVTGPPMY